MSDFNQKLFTRFDKRPNVYMFVLWAFYILVNNTINATSDWMEASRNNAIPEFAFWEPFSWEYSSALSSLLLVPILLWWFRFLPFSLLRIRRFLFFTFIATVVYSALHVSLMVLFRELIYVVMSGNYDFGSVYFEFLYEYRKDAWGYLLFMALYYAYRFIYVRLKGEARLISHQQFGDTANAQQGAIIESETPEHLLVKKLDKEFLVKVSEIEWLESAGNYVNLHAKGRVYPLRSTLSALLPRIASKDFVRVHRSFGVNINQIESISPLPSGDGEIHLLSGKTLALSRRYKDAFRDKVK